jgi:NAD+ synthase (glutamine-hydrolysing)
MRTPTIVNITLAQLNPKIGDLQANCEQIIAAAQTAAAQGDRLLLTPELSLCGYPPRDLLLNAGFLTAIAAAEQDLCDRLPPNLAVLIGSVTPNPTPGSNPLYNSCLWIENGRIQRRFHKRLLPTYDVFDEDRYFAPGHEPNHFELDGLRIGVTICEDLWNDELFWNDSDRRYPINPMADLAELGIDVLVNLSASPYRLGKPSTREAMLRHGSQRYSLPILYVNQVGGNDDLIFDGNSLVLDRQGQIIGRAAHCATDLISVKYDRQQADLVVNQPTRARDARPYESSEAELWPALVLGVRDYVQKCGFKQVVLGLSGGVDSALVATIAAAAIGSDNVFGVLMPSPYSSDHSISDALALGESLGMPMEIVPIVDGMTGFDKMLSGLFAGTESDVTEENLQSRIRGTLLMAISNKLGHLLLTTGNKSEVAVGYCTLYGDMNGGLAVIADLPKTQVYRLCDWINEEGATIVHQQLGQPANSTPIIPTHILTKPPSAELRPGQVDQDSLPPYETLDDILVRLIEGHQSKAQIVAAGHDAAIVDRVSQLVIRAEFKRKQAAPVLKITDRAFGTGWRMPIAGKWML